MILQLNHYNDLSCIEYSVNFYHCYDVEGKTHAYKYGNIIFILFQVKTTEAVEEYNTVFMSSNIKPDRDVQFNGFNSTNESKVTLFNWSSEGNIKCLDKVSINSYLIGSCIMKILQ